MSVFRRGEIWWFKYKFGGQEIRESAKTTSKTLALEAERKRRRAMEESYNGVKKRQAPLLFSIAAKNWLETSPKWRPKTLDLHELCLQHLGPVFGNVLITDITADDIARYQSARLREEAAPRTINIEVGTLRSVLIKYRLWGNIAPDVNMLKEPKSVERALEPGEQERLLGECRASCNRELYPIVEVALNTGLRSDEIRQLRWLQIDFSKKWLQVSHSKTAYGENRIVPINRRLGYVLQLWAERFPERKPQHFVFPFERSGGSGADRTFGFVGSTAYATDPTRSIGSWKKSWSQACKRALVSSSVFMIRDTLQ